MTPERAQLVRESWEQLTPVAPQVAANLYQRLFELEPAARAMFRYVDHDAQLAKIAVSLSTIVAALDNPETLIPGLSQLGRRHQSYGVTDRNYEMLGEALIGTLRATFASKWTPELNDAWVEAYTLIASVMKRAGQRASGANQVVAQ